MSGRPAPELELAIIEYIAWFNASRLHSALSDIPPVEFEALAALRFQTLTHSTTS